MMGLDYIDAFLFTFHLVLLFVNIWALYIVLKLIILTESPNTEKYMLVFKPVEMTIFFVSLIMVIAELYFMINIFIDIKLYYYEYLAIFDEIFFKILAVSYIAREVSNYGKR